MSLTTDFQVRRCAGRTRKSDLHFEFEQSNKGACRHEKPLLRLDFGNDWLKLRFPALAMC
jgi:hypothetical protein